MAKHHEDHPDYTEMGILAGYGEPYRMSCAVCGRACTLAPSTPQMPGQNWYCKPCDAFTESDVEVED